VAVGLDPARWVVPLLISGLAAMVGLLAGYDPRFAIAAALAVGFVLITFFDLAAGLAIFGFLTFVEVASPGSTLSAVKLGGLVLAIAWLAMLATRSEAKLDFFASHRGMSLALLGLVVWVGLSATWATDSGEALTAASRFLLNATLFVIVFTAVRTRRDAVMVVAAFVAGAIGAALYGLLGPQNEAFEAYEGVGRLTGGALDPNQLAASLVPGAVLAIAGAAMSKRSPAARGLWITAFVLCLAGIALTVSRGGLIAAVMAVFAAIVLGGRWRGHAIALACVVGAVGVFYFALFAPEGAKERITESSQGQVKIEEGRTTIWQVAWRAFEANPVIGVGAANFQVVSRQYVLEPGTLARTDEIIDSPAVAHNTFLSIAAELGLVGLGLFLTVVGFSISCAARAARTFSARGDPAMQVLSIGLAVGVIGMLTADFFIAEEYSKQLWLLLGMGPALLAVSRSETVDYARASSSS
jgi:O-antigen ligase